MCDGNKYDESDAGCWFADPRTLPGEYRPAEIVHFREAAEYAQKVKNEERRDVNMDELQQFAERGKTEDMFDD